MPGPPLRAAPEQAAEELEQTAKELESKDRMGNFMSTYDQAETLASSVQKKLDDTVAGQQQKIG